jgi:hypothetical protein
MTADLADLVGRLKQSGHIGASDVLAMRAVVYGGERIGDDDAAALAGLDAAVPDRTSEWGEFYAEVMTDYVVRQQDPPDFVDQAKAAWVIGAMAGPQTVDSGLEAMVRILETAEGAPAELDAFVLDQVKASAVGAGAVSAAHVSLLRRLVFAPGGADNIGVTRAEADILFDIDDACRHGDNDPAWPDFFAKAVADCLTAVSPFHLETREQAQRDEAWLASRESAATFLTHMMGAPKVRSALADIVHPFADMQTEWAAPEAAMETAEDAAAAIDEDEARWLTGRLGQGELSAAEARLIELLKAHATQVSDLLKARFDAAANVSAAHDRTTPTFGRRKLSPA